MLTRMRLAIAVMLVACKGGEGGADMDLDGSGSAAKPGKSGFSAALGDDKAKPADKPNDKPDLAKPPEKPAEKTGLSAAVGSDPKPADPPAEKPVEKPADPVKVAEPPKPATDMKPSDSKVVTNVTPVVPTNVPAPPTSDKPRVPAKVSPEQASVKLSLDPNWDRDIGEPGTISFVLKNNGTEHVFSFAYGIDPPSAPIKDRDAYVKWLADQKILNVELNRQRGGAWYLQGTDGTGAPAFRYVVNYGGKGLVCGGLLYKDAASNALGDLRDKVIIQAKEICETLAL